MAFIQKVIHDLLYVHPLHTMVVHFPIALTASALFFILLALWRKSDLLEQVASANISLASVSTIVAAITGIRDNINLYGGQAPNHAAKIILGSTLFAVTAAAGLVRWRRKDLFHARAGKVLYVGAYFVSFGLAAVLGFLGGVILYGF